MHSYLSFLFTSIFWTHSETWEIANFTGVNPCKTPPTALRYECLRHRGKNTCEKVLEQKTNKKTNKKTNNTQTKTNKNKQTHKHKCKDYYLLLNYEFFSHLSHLSLVCAAFPYVLNRLTSTSTAAAAAAAAEVVVACIACEFHFFVIEVSVEVCSVVKSFITR